MWLWCRPAATALMRSLAWEPPYVAGAALEKAKRQNKNKQTKTKKTSVHWITWFEGPFCPQNSQIQGLRLPTGNYLTLSLLLSPVPTLLAGENEPVHSLPSRFPPLSSCSHLVPPDGPPLLGSPPPPLNSLFLLCWSFSKYLKVRFCQSIGGSRSLSLL